MQARASREAAPIRCISLHPHCPAALFSVFRATKGANRRPSPTLLGNGKWD